MNFIIWFIFLNLNFALAFEGIIEYKIEDNSKSSGSNLGLKIGIKNDLLRYDLGKWENQKLIPSMSTVINYSKQSFACIFKDHPLIRNFSKPFVDKDFLLPEETISRKTKKLILGTTAEEHEAFYFTNKTRLPITAWYAAPLDMPKHVHIWHLNKVHAEIGMLNFLFHPGTHKIALEMNYFRVDGSKRIFKAIKMERKSLDASYFSYPEKKLSP